MSHVAEMETVINSLDCLEKACKANGLELVRGQKTYKWFGEHVGDYPIPAGFKAADLGKCDHAIVIPGNDEAYEIGVVKNPNGEGYVLLWDFWGGGYGLQEKVGENGFKLINEYLKEETVTAFHEEYEGQGFNFSFERKKNGDIYVEVEN